MKNKMLGRLPAKNDTRALMFARFSTPLNTLPEKTNFWTKRSKFPLKTFGNTTWGDCTLAKQAVAAMRMERLETKKTINITDDEIVTRYHAMTKELYGTLDDVGAYETDALSRWRDPEHTFKDADGHPYTIAAFTRLNHLDHQELKQGLWTAGAHGIAVCLNLPIAFESIAPPKPWDIPEGEPMVDNWMPGSWGGHSMWARDYDSKGIWLCHTWGLPDQLLTWRAAAAYLDEAHLVIDSIDVWRKKPGIKKFIDLDGIKRAVNKVSHIRIES